MPEKFILKDPNGKQYVAFKTTAQIPTSHLQSTHRESIEGLPSYRLADGRALNYDPASDTFAIVETGEILVRTRT